MTGITSISLTDSGALYSEAPTVTIAAPDIPAKVAAVSSSITGEKVSGLSVDSGGYYYTYNPTLTISDPTTPIKLGAVTSTLDGLSVGSLSIDSAGSYYTENPTLTVDVPNAPIAPAELTFTVVDGRIVSTFIDSGGYYYTSSPTVAIDPPPELSNNVDSDQSKFGSRSYKFRKSTFIDETFTLPSPVSTIGATTAFWVYLVDPEGGTGCQFDIQISDETRVYSEGNRIYIRYSNQPDGVGGGSIRTADLGQHSYPGWHHVGVFRDFFQINQSQASSRTFVNIDGSQRWGGSETVIFNGYNEMLSSDVILRNSVVNPSYAGWIDDIYNDQNNTGSTVPSTSRDEITFELNPATATAFITNGRVTGVGITNNGSNYSSGVESTVSAPTGSPADYRATATGTVENNRLASVTITDSGDFYVTPPNVSVSAPAGSPSDFTAAGSVLTLTNGQVSSVSITDSGSFYTSAPSVTVTSPTGTPEDFRATATANYDTASKRISSIDITDSGFGYSTPPAVTIAAPNEVELAFIQGETVSQTLPSGVVISGEVAKYSDSSNTLYLMHVGSDDGKYHTFLTDYAVTGGTSGIIGNVTSVGEENDISANEQNDDFTTVTLDFLDFTEANPFGDPENN